MLTQEEYVQRVLELKRQGWSITEIATEVGYHPATISKWLKQGGPPTSPTADDLRGLFASNSAFTYVRHGHLFPEIDKRRAEKLERVRVLAKFKE